MGNIIKSSTSKASKAESHINIPEEIIVEILSRLPLGSLPRFTCVSKQWRSLISNIIVAKSGSPRVLLISDSRAYSFSPHSIDQNHQHEVDVNSIHVPWKLSESGDHEFKILGSCNGLVLIHIDDDLFLWNPLTRFFKKVLASDRVCDRWKDHRVCSGLCYDSTSDEYKAVLVNSSLTPGYGDASVAVGSFRSKSWTTIAFPYSVPSWDSWPITVNGNLHWFASKMDSEKRYYFSSPHQIIYFNAHMDKFKEVPMPEPKGEDGNIICGLGVLDGNLCMSRLDNPGNSKNNVEVLVMKEYAVAKSWTILFVVSDGLNFDLHELAPLGYTKNGEYLTRVSTWKYVGYGRHIRAFNPIDNSHRKITIPDDHRLYIFVQEESLITPADYGWEEEDLKGKATYVVVNSDTGRSWKMKKGSDGRYWASTCMHKFLKRNNMDGGPIT